MSSIKSALLLAALTLAATAHADGVRCPSQHENVPLSGAIVYDGPTEDLADLMPDKSKGAGNHATSTWEVGYIYDAGRHVYLVCKYDAEIITIHAENKLHTCTYRTHPGKKPVEMFCK